ncbi:MAG TPA: DUF932 domain-containing protein [Ignavibacteriaceae bacterium]|nr:DUF932 domain-containing protein [Ignavibacteriaceae bacterium]
MIENKLKEYLFPVQEKKVYFEGRGSSLEKTQAYKSIIRVDTGKLISIMNNTYQLIPNSEIIKPLLEQLSKLDSKWYIDESHSFVQDNRMRLQVTFPDLTFNDGRSDIALSLFLNNSYDGSEGIRMHWGAIRFICTNGMVFGKVLSKFYSKHTSGFRLNNLIEQVNQTYDSIPVIKERIELLQGMKVTKTLIESVDKQLGKKVIKQVHNQKSPGNQWILYNYITWYISHVVEYNMRAAYQLRLSRLFGL